MSEAASAAAGSESPDRVSALLVDDSKTQSLLYAAVLQHGGFDVTAVASVAAALEKLRSGVFQIVVSDVHLEEDSGADLCAKIRADPSMASLCVVLYSSMDADELGRLAKAVGATGGIQKGGNRAEFCAQVKKFLDESPSE